MGLADPGARFHLHQALAQRGHVMGLTEVCLGDVDAVVTAPLLLRVVVLAQSRWCEHGIDHGDDGVPQVLPADTRRAADRDGTCAWSAGRQSTQPGVVRAKYLCRSVQGKVSLSRLRTHAAAQEQTLVKDRLDSFSEGTLAARSFRPKSFHLES
jgi:hypothetical protein